VCSSLQTYIGWSNKGRHYPLTFLFVKHKRIISFRFHGMPR
jgi:hypothetical protein